MSCSFYSSEHLEIMRQESELSNTCTIMDKFGNERIIPLKRGGCYVETQAGPVQFGMPPETVKDHMACGSEVPTIYILPTKRFHKRYGINVAEFEFPAYFNFFLKKKQINLVCTKEAEQAIRVVFQETLIGPKEHKNLAEEFYYTFDKNAIPDFPKERSYFAKNPMNPSELVTIDHLIRFTLFDENGIAHLENDVAIRQEPEFFTIIQSGLEIARIRDEVEIHVEPEFEEYDSNNFVPLDYFRNITNDKQKIKPFEPPLFGITVLGASHGFDPHGSTSGYIIWINGRGIMLDPPPFSYFTLKKHAIPPSLIESVIISHCHADHDAGAFQKILESQKIEFITTRTIMESFVRKYSALTNLDQEMMRKLFKFRPAIIGAPMVIHGAQFRFFYSVHTIPCIGFEVHYSDRSIFFSGDTCYDPPRMLEMKQQGLISQRRYEMLVNNKWNYDLIIHEAGVPPIHTPVSTLANLPKHVKERMVLAHIAAKDIPQDTGLKGAPIGLENTMVIDVIPHKGLQIFKKIDLLSQIDVFDGLSLKSARDLIQCSTEEHYKAGQIILKEGTSGLKFYLIQQGICKIYSEKGDANFVRYAVAGDYFGESVLLSNNSRRGATVEAITDVTLFVVEKHDLWFALGDDKGLESPALQKLFNLSKSRKSKAFSTISKNILLSELNQTQKTQLEMILTEQEVPEKKILWKAGNKAEFAFLVVKGAFKFVACKEAEHDSFEKGAFIGEVNAMLSNEPLTTTIKAVTDSVIYVMLKDDLLAFLAKNPGLLVLFRDVKFFE